MIYTITLNPSVDYIVSVAPFELGKTNRTNNEMKNPGGKGINVSRVLKKLNISSKSLGFVGGFTGGFIENKLQKEMIDTDFIKVNGDTRINVKLKTTEETEINGQSPFIHQDDLEELIKKLQVLKAGDILVLAGSVPDSLPKSTYYTLLKEVEGKGVITVVDTSGEALESSLSANPFLIKPNHHELAEIAGKEELSINEAVSASEQILEKGVENIIVSMAGEGALLLSKGKKLFASVPKGIVENSVGAGDSVVAGFVASFSQERDLEKAFKYGIAAGSATAFSKGFCEKEQIEKLINQVELSNI